MDLNYVFLRQQVERSLAKSAGSSAARKEHEKLARAYELTIERKSGGRIIFPGHRNDASDDFGTERPIIARPNPSTSS